MVEVRGEAQVSDLVRQARDGDRDAFRLLHERYHRRLYAYAYFRLGETEEARDVVQDVFLVVWQRLADFELRHEGSFPGWLFRIAHNVVADRSRRARRRPTAPLEAATEPHVEFEGRTLSQRLLVDALRKLPETQREVVMLRFLLDLSVADVAAAVGKTEGAVMQLQLRGLQRLRREIGTS